MINIIFIITYFLLMLYLGFYFRKKNLSSDDFFYGRGKIPWVWVGTSAFVSQFSASSFTIIAGRAYTDGFSVLIVYWASALSFVLAALYFAPKLRQLKIASPVEAVRMRFGSINEKLLSILSIPSYLIFPALWLNSLAVFISGAFDINTKTTIIIVGIITLSMSVLGGSWTIISSDFIQFIIIFVLGISTACVALIKIGGPQELFLQIPVQSIVPQNMQLVVFVVWVTYMSLQKSMNTNNIFNTLRFNSVESSNAAKKAAWTAVIIYIVGSFIWFIPAWASRILIPNIQETFPNLARPQMASYLVFIKSFMPAGVLGLSVAALFAATMSSIDSSLNWCAGFLTRSFYRNKPHNIRIARIYTCVFGIIVILVGLYYENVKNTSLFDLTYQLITYIYIPILIPMLLALWIKKTPDWSFTLSIVIGFIVSIVLTSNTDSIQSFIHWFFNTVKPYTQVSELSSRDVSTLVTFLGLFAQIIITGGFFTLSQLFFKEFASVREAPLRNADVTEFYTRLKTPILDLPKKNRDPWIQKSTTVVNAMALGTGLVIIEFILLSQISLPIFIVLTLATISTIIYKTLKSNNKRSLQK